MVVSEQTHRIVALLVGTDICSMSELSGELGVSERTVRAYLAHANDELAGCAHLEHKRGQGYRLVVDDAAAFDAWQAEASVVTPAVPDTAEQRVGYLLNDLLARTDWVTVADLARVLFVSRRTISHDLATVEEILNKNGLELERRPHYGLRVTGSEMARRLCLANIALRTERAQDGASGQDGAPSPLSALGIDELLGTVADCVNTVLETEDITIGSVFYHNLLVHIAVAIMRIREGCYVPMARTDLDRARESAVYPAATRIASAIADAFALTLPEEEVAYIAIHLAGKQLLDMRPADAGTADGALAGDDPRSDDAADAPVISDEVWEIVNKMIEVVRRMLRFDFRNDLELRMGLAQHIVPLSVRLTYHMRIENPLVNEIKQRFPLAYSMAIEASTVLADAYGSALSDEELGYIALSFALALERQKGGISKKNILVVCASGMGSARLLEHRYREEFGAYLNRIDVCDLARLARWDLSDIDYVFTTVPIAQKLPVPVCEVKYFLDSHDLTNVRTVLTEQPAAGSALRYFSRDLFFPHLVARSRDEVLDMLIERMRARRDLPERFGELVHAREAVVSTAFGNRVAMPHPLESVAERTFVCTGLLDEPLDWDGNPVRVVLLVAVGHEGPGELDGFYNGFTSMLASEQAIDELLERQDFDTLVNIFDACCAEADS